jgi:PKD repeat protein
MKNRFVLIIALVALVSCMIAPVSAQDAQMNYVGNFSSTSGTVITHQSAVDICTLYGLSPAAHPTDGLWWTYCSGRINGRADDSPVSSCINPQDYGGTSESYTHTVVNNWYPGRDTLVESAQCGPSGYSYYSRYWYISEISSSTPPVASFSCTPTSQNPDTSVVCIDTSTNTPTDWLWSIDMEGAGIEGWQTHTGQNFTWQSHYPGLYSVNLRANNSAGSDWENKTNYVSISVNATPNNCNLPVASGYIRTYAQTNDGMTSGGIYGSQIQMRDMEGGAWSNTTSSEGYWCIDTLPGHSLNLYAQATGYTSTSQLGVSANGGRYYLVLWPDYIPPPSAGNVSLYVLVYDQQTGTPLYLSSVRVDGNAINTVLKNTGPEGQAIFTIKNNTAIHVTASKAGYNTVTRTMTTSSTGPDTLMISLPRSTVTVAPTQTTGPGGTVPTTIGPYGTPGPGGTMAPGYTNNQGQLMMDFLARNGLSLVELCFFVTVLALLGVKLGK